MRQTLSQMRRSVHAELTNKTPEEGGWWYIPFFHERAVKPIVDDSRSSASRRRLVSQESRHNPEHVTQNKHNTVCEHRLLVQHLCTLYIALYIVQRNLLEVYSLKHMKHSTGWWV